MAPDSDPNLFGTEPTGDAPRPGGAWTYLRVAVERGLDQGGTGTGLTYRSREPVEVGRRVEVPLGRSNTGSAGIVVAAGGLELLDGFPASRIKSILRDTGTGLPPRLVELARWMSGYYVCPLGMTLAAMLPAAVKKRTGLRTLIRLDRVDDAIEQKLLAELKLTKQARGTWDQIAALGRDALPLPPDELATRLGARTLGPINRLLRTGLLREVESEDVRQSGGVQTQMGIEQADPSGAALSPGRPVLTPDQSKVVDGISTSLDAFGVHLIRGVTGSGKTEVYLRILEQVLTAGRTGLVLVPEISLTPQTAGRFVERFRAAGVGVLHSGLSASQRHREWSRAASGAARVMVGARSAIFAPIANLGLIIVDEEHASDYKQDQLLRYHGRDVAIKRAQMENCPIVLGSATPSLESWANASPLRDPKSAIPNPQSKYALWELPSRVGGGRLPRVEVVDLREEREIREQTTGRRDAHPPHLHMIGPTLQRAIGETLGAGGQILLLLNRRGYASYIACPDSTCGWVLTCDECDVKMVQHRVIAGKTPPKGVVRCHHCLAQSLLPERCPVCDKRLITLGLGTQGLESELGEKFATSLGPDRSGLMRVDGDTMASAKDYFAVLSKFAKGEIKILVGTQMIAKGLDFPNVRLVGVINADTALSLPDFRASERTFQLVSQVAGRAGRGSLPGRVIVQSFDASAPAISFAAQHDYIGFATQELAIRRESRLPPTTRLARIVLRDTDLSKAQAAADRLRKALDEANAARASKVSLIGPGPCPIARIAGHHRLELLLFSSSRLAIQEILADARAKGLVKSDAHTAVDIDPIALM